MAKAPPPSAVRLPGRLRDIDPQYQPDEAGQTLVAQEVAPGVLDFRPGDPPAGGGSGPALYEAASMPLETISRALTFSTVGDSVTRGYYSRRCMATRSGQVNRLCALINGSASWQSLRLGIFDAVTKALLVESAPINSGLGSQAMITAPIPAFDLEAGRQYILTGAFYGAAAFVPFLTAGGSSAQIFVYTQRPMVVHAVNNQGALNGSLADMNPIFLPGRDDVGTPINTASNYRVPFFGAMWEGA